MQTHTIVRIAALIVCLTWLWLLTSPLSIVAAHDGGPRLKLIPPQIMPGDTLEVEGINLGTDLLVTVVLEKEGWQQVLGKVLCDGHGDFTTSFTLPEDLAAGVYTIAVIDHSVAGMEIAMASSTLRVGRAGVFTSTDFTWSNDVLWAGAGILLLILLPVPILIRQLRAADSTRT